MVYTNVGIGLGLVFLFIAGKLVWKVVSKKLDFNQGGNNHAGNDNANAEEDLPMDENSQEERWFAWLGMGKKKATITYNIILYIYGLDIYIYIEVAVDLVVVVP